MTVILKPADAKGRSGNDSSIAVDIRTEEGKQSQVAGLLLALANALRKAVAESPSAETAAEFVTKVIPTPIASPSVPAGRPAWVEASPELVDGVYRVPLAIGPFESRMECDRKLPEALRQALNEYVDQCLGSEAVGRISLPREYLQTHLVRQTWVENRRVAVTPTEQVPMVLLHVLLGFDNDVKTRLTEMWHRVVIVQRLRTVGLAVTCVLALLATFWAYLRIDLATAGAYRNRLRLATALVLALLAALASTLA